jgi:hypothetical protein
MVYVSITNDELLDHQNDNKGEKDANKSKPMSIKGTTKSLSSNSLREKIKRKQVFKIIMVDLETQIRLFRYFQNQIFFYHFRKSKWFAENLF